MASMYETIMELPLFKGIGTEQLSLMLEKTSLGFYNYEAGAQICHAGDQVKHIDFILSGEISCSRQLENMPLVISEKLGKGCVLGASNLYGLLTTYPSTAIALKKVSVMRIGKEEYMNILRSDSIYLLNYLNFLSAAAQRAGIRSMKATDFNITDFLTGFLSTMVSPLAQMVEIIGKDSVLAAFCGVKAEDFQLWKLKNNLNGDIEVTPQSIIFHKLTK